MTGSLNPREVKSAAITDMRLMCTDAQAQEIVRYYDRKGTGEIDVPLFVSDVCSGVQSILHFEELSARGIAENKRALAENPFIIKPFKALPNKFLERFKRDVMIILGKKVRASWTFTASPVPPFPRTLHSLFYSILGPLFHTEIAIAIWYRCTRWAGPSLGGCTKPFGSGTSRTWATCPGGSTCKGR